MNVLFLSRLFYPHIGGVEKHVMEVSKQLAKKGCEVTVLTEKFDEQLSDNEIYEDIHIIRMPVSRHGWFKKFVIWWWLIKNLSVFKTADIVHVHDVFFWYLPFRLLFPRKKIYTTFHGYEGNAIPKKRKILMHKIAEKLSNGNICIGEFLAKWYGTKPSAILYGGISPQKEEKIVIPSGKKLRIVFIGRLAEETGIMMFLQGAKILLDQGILINMLILGDGGKREDYEHFCRTNSIKAHFYKFIPDVEKYIRKADIVFASRYLAMLESLYEKKLVFAVYNNAIKKDYLELTPFHKDIIVAKNDHELAEEVLFHLHNPRLIYQKVESGYAFASKQTWEYVTYRYLKLWGYS